MEADADGMGELTMRIETLRTIIEDMKKLDAEAFLYKTMVLASEWTCAKLVMDKCIVEYLGPAPEEDTEFSDVEDTEHYDAQYDEVEKELLRTLFDYPLTRPPKANGIYSSELTLREAAIQICNAWLASKRVHRGN